MASAQTFDLARTTFDSWPWVFGQQWMEIVGKARDGGIAAASSQVHLLVLWCAAFETEENVQNKLVEIESLTVQKGTRKEPAPDWMKLHQLLMFCVKVAKDNGAWLFNKKQEQRAMLTMTALKRTGNGSPNAG